MKKDSPEIASWETSRATATSASARFAQNVVRRLQDHGHQALWAGGCVRDLALNLEPMDYDVATGALPREVMRIFPKTVPVGISFGVVRVLGRRDLDEGEVEVATFRSDGAYLDGRRPESVTFGAAKEDAQRRDFTINGMFFDPIQNEFHDYVGGRRDLASGIVRAIGEPSARFGEDKLRLIRAVRFAARFGFRIDPATWSALTAMAAELPVVAPERIAQELQKMLAHSNRSRAIQLCLEAGLLPFVFPNIPTPASDASVWDGAISVLAQLETPDIAKDVPLSYPLLFAALWRDQPPALVDRLCRDLRFSNDDRQKTVWLTARREALRAARDLPRHALKRLLAHPLAEDLLRGHQAEARAFGLDDSHVAYCREYIGTQPDGPLDPPPLITGEDLKMLGIPPGPRYAELLETVRNAQLDGLVHDRDGALDLVRIPNPDRVTPA